MSSLDPVLVDIEEFTKNANDYYERARNGERIVVTVEGAEEYEVFTDVDKASGFFSEMPRPAIISQTDYEDLLDLLDPLDCRD